MVCHPFIQRRSPWRLTQRAEVNLEHFACNMHKTLSHPLSLYLYAHLSVYLSVCIPDPHNTPGSLETFNSAVRVLIVVGAI
jgi:hypothetical protein